MRRLIFIILFMFSALLFGEFEKTNLGITAYMCDLTSDNTGQVHIVWQQTDGLHYGILVGTEIQGDEFIPNSASMQNKFSRPRIAVRPDGANVHIVWSDKPTNKVLLASKIGGGAWETETVWNNGGKAVAGFAANVGEDLTGTIHVIFQRFDKLPVDISKITYYYKRNGNWSNRQTLFTGSSKWRDTNMFTDRDGGIHIRWGRFAGPADAYYRYAPSGSLLTDSENILIKAKAGIFCVSMGDLFVDAQMNVHHAFMGYKMGAYFYAVKPAGSDEFEGYTKPSHGAIPICEAHNLDNPWPSIAVDSNGTPYVSWVEMPCPSHDPNVVKVSKLNDAGAWEIITLDDQAYLWKESKPAMTATDTCVYVAWRTSNGSLILATEGTPGGGGIQFLSPANGSKVCGTVDISLQGNDGTDPITNIELFIDDNSMMSVDNQSTLTYTWDVTSDVPAGEHTIKAVVTRQSGDSSEGSIIVDKDCPPTVRIAFPIQGSSVFDIEPIIATAMDDKGVADVTFFVNDVALFKDMSSPYEYMWDTDPYEDGADLVVKVQATDTGAQTAVDQVDVKVERIYPPTDAAAEQKTNRSLFHVEYFHHITWSSNPQNSNKNVVKYRIRRVMSDGTVEHVAYKTKNGSSTFEYAHRNIDPDQTYTYRISAIIMRDHVEVEGKPVTVVVVD